MSTVFRARFVAGLKKQFEESNSFYESLFKNNWVVYCKVLFYQNTQVVEYLGRYTHKIAISNHRIITLAESKVSFSAKDYRKAGAKYTLTLTDAEFIRPFSLHFLPKGFTRIRHYDILSSSSSVKKKILPLLRAQLPAPRAVKSKPELQHRRCSICKKGTLVTVYIFGSRGPPPQWIRKLKNQDKISKK